MKPMPYEIVPPVEHMNPHGACFDMYQCPACLERMKLRDDPKQLSDAECAAEFWRAEINQNGDWEKTYPFHDEDHPLWERYLTSSKQAETWYRFATTPHAFGGG